MKLKENSNTEAAEKYQEVTEFQFQEDMYTAPGMTDLVTIHENGKKKQLHKHHLKMYLHEFHSFLLKAILVLVSFFQYLPC